MKQLAMYFQRFGFAVSPPLAGNSRKTSHSDSRVIPNKFWTVKRVVKDNKHRVHNLRCLADQLIQLSVNNGDEETYKRAHARLCQAKAEVMEMIEEKTGSAPSALSDLQANGAMECLGNEAQGGSSDGGSSDDDIPLTDLVVPHPPAIPVKNRKQRALDNSKNNSALCRPGKTKSKGKKGTSKSAKGGGKTRGEGNMIRRRLLEGQESGRGKKSSRTRQNPILTRIKELGRSHGAESRSDGVGDFNIAGYDLKPEGVQAETATIESHNIPRDDRDPAAI